MSVSSHTPLINFRTLLCLTVLLLNSPVDQVTAQDHLAQFREGRILFVQGKYEEALELIRDLNEAEDLDESLKQNARMALLSTLSKLSQASRSKEQWKVARKYSEETLEWLDKSTTEFEGEVLEQLKVRRLWACKNMVLACHGLGEFEKANEYRKELYDAWDNEALPDGLNRCFNFSFFRHQNKNVWGYEYYPELDDTEVGESFSKFVFFIYSTNDDGSDKEQLYRLHVLKFHNLLGEPSEVDFILTKRWMVGEEEGSLTCPEFTWSNPVNTEQLGKDILRYLEENPEPSDDEAGDADKDD